MRALIQRVTKASVTINEEELEKIEKKMTDLAMTTLCNEQCEEGEVSAYYLEGPNHGKYADYKSCGNVGKFLAGLRKIDMERDITWCSPQWLRQRKQENEE